ncbi:MAG: arginase family protein [Chloroflexota bacterium]
MSETFLVASPMGPGKQATVIGAALATPYVDRDPHATGSPKAIRAASQRLARFVGHHDFDTGVAFAPWLDKLGDAGDVDTDASDPEGNRQRIESALVDLLVDGSMPILLGGDDSVAIPFIAAWREHGPITVVQLDAHLDFRDAVGGNRFGYSSPMRRASESAWVRRIIHIGQRGVGSARPGDLQDSLEAGNTIVTAREFAAHGVAATAELLDAAEPFVIVLDVDAIDPAQVPSVRAPVAAGPSVATVSDLSASLAERGSFRGLVVTEFEPELDPTGASALILVRLIGRLLDTGLAKQHQP